MRCPVVQSHCSALFMTFREGNGKKKEYGAAGEYRVGLLGATCAQSGRSERQPIHPAHVSDTTAVAAPRPSPQPQPSLPQPPAGSASFRSQRDAAPIVPGTSYDVCRPQCEEEALKHPPPPLQGDRGARVSGMQQGCCPLCPGSSPGWGKKGQAVAGAWGSRANPSGTCWLESRHRPGTLPQASALTATELSNPPNQDSGAWKNGGNGEQWGET